MATTYVPSWHRVRVRAPGARLLGADRRALTSALRIAVLAAAGGLPVLSITAHVCGVVSMATAARYVDLPATLVALALMLNRSAEGVWAARGVVAGLVAVTAYDTLRLPFVFAHLWPDFFQEVGSWVIAGNGTENLALGYVWRYLGDGGGIGVVFFLGAVLFRLRTHVVAWALGYGVLVWLGLLATVALPADGEQLLFDLTPASFGLSLAGHIVYGATLGVCYRYAVGRFGLPGDPATSSAGRRISLPLQPLLPGRS